MPHSRPLVPPGLLKEHHKQLGQAALACLRFFLLVGLRHLCRDWYGLPGRGAGGLAFVFAFRLPGLPTFPGVRQRPSWAAAAVFLCQLPG